MTCDYSINIDGKKYVLFSSDEEINSLSKLRSVLYKKITSDNVKAFGEIKNALISLDNIPEINLDDVTENSVGLHSPAELISEISKSRLEEALWRKLKIANWDKNIVVAGFGNETVKTQFHKGHIYLNLNYLDGFSNNIIALTELALFNVYKEEYSEINLSELINSSNQEDLDYADEVLESIISSTTNQQNIDKLKRNIKAAYYKSNVTAELGSRNINSERLNLPKVWDKFLFNEETKDTKYYPKSTIRVEDLKQGDLVLIPNPDKVFNKKATDWYEIFYDYYVDANNNFVIRTLGKNGETGNHFLRNRPANIYDYDDDKKLKIKENGKAVQARLYTEEVIQNYKYNDNDKYTAVAVNFGIRHMKYDWIYNLLKNPGAKIVTKKSVKEGDVKKEVLVTEKIVKVEGQIITLENDKKINIIDVKNIGIPTPNLDVEMNEENFDMNYKTPSVGERVIVINDKKEVVGLVVGFNVEEDKVIYVFNDKEGPKSVATNPSNIKAVEYPKDKNEFKLGDTLPKLNIYIKNKLQGAKSVQESLLANRGYNINLENLPLNVEDVHEFSSIKEGSILYNPTIKQFHKVIDSNFDRFDESKSYLKTVVELNGKLKYINIPRNSLNNYIMFNGNLNTTFAEFNITKNAFELFATPQDNGSYVEVKVYKNPNGFKFVLPISEDVTKSALYEKGTVEITNAHKETLKARYKWPSIPKSLYAKLEKSGRYKKDTMNTTFLPFDNNSLKRLLDSSEDLYKLVPGSFITFENDAKAYIVEKILKNKIQLAKYSYTKYDSGKDEGDLSHIRSERILVSADTKLKLAGVHIPKWAPNSYESIKHFSVQSDPIEGNKKSIHDSTYSDSKEFVIQLSEFLADKFGVRINIIRNSDVAQFGDPTLFKAAAFVTKNEIYVNIDKASIAEPLHEMLHLVMATLKNNDSETYYRIVNSVQYHPMFKKVAGLYLEINTELLEETFIKLFTLTFRNNVLKAGIFNEEEFNKAIKNSIQDMLNLEESLDWEDSFDLMKRPIRDILTEFGSSLLANEESLLDKSSVYTMFDIADTIRELLENGKLDQKCNY